METEKRKRTKLCDSIRKRIKCKELKMSIPDKLKNKNPKYTAVKDKICWKVKGIKE